MTSKITAEEIFQEFAATLILQVFGGGGAIWVSIGILSDIVRILIRIDHRYNSTALLFLLLLLIIPLTSALCFLGFRFFPFL